jgi:hypothetical protein
MEWTRDWVFKVIKPFLAQTKNRLANIKLEKLDNGKLKFTNAENISEEFTSMDEPLAAGTYGRTKQADGTTGWTGISLATGSNAIVVNEIYPHNTISFNDTTWHSEDLSEFEMISGEQYKIWVKMFTVPISSGREFYMELRKSSDGSLLKLLDRATSSDGSASMSGTESKIMEDLYQCEQTENVKIRVYFRNVNKDTRHFFSTDPAKGTIVKVSRLNGMTGSAHTHSNQVVLDKLFEIDGDIYYEDNQLINKLEWTDEQIRQQKEAIQITKASEGCINPNPYFILGDMDYEKTINGTTRTIVTDIVDNYPASFKNIGGTLSMVSDNFIPIVKDREYRASASVRFDDPDDPSSTKKVSYYLGVVSYDADKNIIYPHHLPADNRKLGILTTVLKTGDTEFTFTADAQIFPDGLPAHAMTVLGYKAQPNGEYSYIGVNGKIYKHLRYSRYVMLYSYTTAPVDNGDGTWTMTLAKPWDGAQLNIGDAVTRSQSGGTYNYWISSKTEPIDRKFHEYNSPWMLYETNDNYIGGYTGITREGASYVKMLVLPNYGLYESDNTYIGTAHNMPKLEGYYNKLALEWRNVR